MKTYTSPKLLVLGSVADETLASTVKPIPKCSGSGDNLAETIKDAVIGIDCA